MKLEAKVHVDDLLVGLQQLKSSFPNVAIAIKKEFGGECVREGKLHFTPVVTGNLVTTLRVEQRGKKVFFVSGGIMGKGTPPRYVGYARYVEEGTSRMAPRLFMQKSALSAQRNASSFAKQILHSWLAQLKA